MSAQLEQMFTEIRNENKNAIDTIGTYQHPLLILLKQTLEDQKNVLDSLLMDLTAQSDPPLTSLKKDCTHVYHANEVAMPFYESWMRAVKWMPDESSSIEKSLGDSMTMMHEKLEHAARTLEADHGHMAVKYMIPTFYLPAT